MKKTIMKILSYVLVATVAAGTAVICCVASQREDMDKLEYVRMLVEQCFIGEVDGDAMDDAAAAAMVASIGDRWSRYMTA